MGGDLLVKTLRAIEAGTAPRTPQDHSQATYTRQLNKDICPIDWTKSPRQIVKHVCGLSPWPVATAELAGTHFKIYRAEREDGTTDAAPGTILELTKKGLKIACGNGEIVTVTQLQAEGGKRMAAADYFRGHPLRI